MLKKIFVIFVLIGFISLSGCIDSSQAPNFSVDNKDTTDSGIFDCGESEWVMNQCFLDAAKECTPASVTVTSGVGVLGATMWSKNYYEIKGYEEDNCEYYFRIIETTFEMSDELIEQMKENGSTQEEIDETIEQANEKYKQTAGLESTCFYPVEDLIKKLEQENGLGEEIDYDKAIDQDYFDNLFYDNPEKYNCTGSFYNFSYYDIS